MEDVDPDGGENRTGFLVGPTQKESQSGEWEEVRWVEVAYRENERACK